MGALLSGLLCSCIGVGANITLRQDGSGTILLEYRIARELESLGKLDGNEQWLPVPVGRADLERTVARIPGLTMQSFQSRNQKKDIHIRTLLAFADPQALCAFLDAAGQGAALIQTPGQRRLSLTLGAKQEPLDQDLAGLLTQALEGYTWDLTLSLPAEGEFLVLGPEGQKPVSQWVRLGSGRAAYSAPMGALLNAVEPIRLEARWTP